MSRRVTAVLDPPRRRATSLDAQYARFACPQEGFDAEFAAALAVEHARVVVRQFVHQAAKRVSVRTRGLLEYLEAVTDRTQSFETVWDYSFGMVHAALSDDSVDAVRAAVAMGLQLCSSGGEGRWEATLARAFRIRVGKHLLPEGNRLAVQSTPAGFSVEIGTGRRRTVVTFERAADGWVSREAEQLPICELPGRQLVLLPARALQFHESNWMLPLLERRRPARGIASVEAAGRLLEAYAPEYLIWVSRVIRHIVPWRQAPMMQNSGSTADSPGLIGLSAGDEPAATAQMLVHEATHQYMYMLGRLGPLDDGSDSTLYYSPVRRTDRPIGAIVVAYHAAANEVIFFRSCRKNGLWNSFFEHMEDTRVSQLQALEDALQTSRAITPLGRALWEPLFRRLHGT